MNRPQVHELLTLPIEERVEILEILHRSIEQEPLPEWHRQLLDERLREAEQDPDASVGWEEVHADLRAELQSRRGA